MLCSPSLLRGDFRASLRRTLGFTLVEMLVVMGIIAILLGLLAPAFNAVRGGGDITKASYDVSGALETARTFAMANNTYTWVGFFEEDPTKASGTAGTGQVVVSIVASKDGTTVYTTVGSPATAIDPTRLLQVGKLIKVSSTHLKTAVANDAVFPIGDGTGNTFPTRPPTSGTTSQIGDTSPNASLTPFQYPVGGTTAAPAQYTFVKALQFSPRGEVRVDNTNYTVKTVVEVGLQPTHGNVVDSINKNVVAIQLTGISGNVRIYRR